MECCSGAETGQGAKGASKFAVGDSDLNAASHETRKGNGKIEDEDEYVHFWTEKDGKGTSIAQNWWHLFKRFFFLFCFFSFFFFFKVSSWHLLGCFIIFNLMC